MTTNPDETRKNMDKMFIAFLVLVMIISVIIMLMRMPKSIENIEYSTINTEIVIKNGTTAIVTFNILSNYTIEIYDIENTFGYYYNVLNETLENETVIIYNIDLSIVEGPVTIKITNLDLGIWEAHEYD